MLLSPVSRTNAPPQESVFDRKLHLQGMVLDDATGQPIPRFKVLFGRQAVWGHMQPVPSFHGLTAPPRFLGEGYDGVFDWNFSPQSAELTRFQLEVRTPGYAPEVSGTIEASNNTAVITFRLKRSDRITAKVLTPDGTPAVGAKLCLAGKDSLPTIRTDPTQQTGCHLRRQHRTQQTTTDGEGKFWLKPIAGADRLIVLHDSGCRIVRLTDLGSEQVVLQAWGGLRRASDRD